MYDLQTVLSKDFCRLETSLKYQLSPTFFSLGKSRFRPKNISLTLTTKLDQDLHNITSTGEVQDLWSQLTAGGFLGQDCLQS